MARHMANGPGDCSPRQSASAATGEVGIRGRRAGPALGRRPMSGTHRRPTTIDKHGAGHLAGGLADQFNREADGLDPVAFFYPCGFLY